MQERGIDISGQRSKHLSEYLSQPFDTVITSIYAPVAALPRGWFSTVRL